MVRSWARDTAVVAAVLLAACGGSPAADRPAPVDDLDIEPRRTGVPSQRAERGRAAASPQPTSTRPDRAQVVRRGVQRAGGGRIDIDVVGADLHNLFRLLADVGGVNIVVDDAVQGQVTLRLRGVPWRDVVDAVASLKELQVIDSAGILIIRRRE